MQVRILGALKLDQAGPTLNSPVRQVPAAATAMLAFLRVWRIRAPELPRSPSRSPACTPLRPADQHQTAHSQKDKSQGRVKLRPSAR